MISYQVLISQKKKKIQRQLTEAKMSGFLNEKIKIKYIHAGKDYLDLYLRIQPVQLGLRSLINLL